MPRSPSTPSERSSIWTPGEIIDIDDARDALLPSPAGEAPILAPDIRQGIDLNGIIDQVARDYLKQGMQHTGGNKTRAAKLLGLGRPTTLTNWLKKHGGEL